MDSRPRQRETIPQLTFVPSPAEAGLRRWAGRTSIFAHGGVAMRIAVLTLALAAVLAGCSGILPRESTADTAEFQTYNDLQAAYDKIIPGTTTRSQLAEIGLDPNTLPNITVLSYVEVMDKFMPQYSPITLDRVAKGARACIEAKNRCSGLVFRFDRRQTRHNGNVVADVFQFRQDKVKYGWSAEIILLMRDDDVVYKLMSGMPYAEERMDNTRPLGPLQDVDGVSKDKPKKTR
jgi:hypothetical protein